MDNVYVVSAARTAVAKSKRGAYAYVHPVDLGAAAIREAVKRAKLVPEAVADVAMGCAMPEAEQGMNMARLAAVEAGLPDSVPAVTINRFCSSGLEAMATAAAKIEAGFYEVAVAGGIESMSHVPMDKVKVAPAPWIIDQRPEYFIGMGCAGDAVARENGFTREMLDAFALNSHQKAVAAIQDGRFKDEIVPVTVPNGNGGLVVDTDEGPRPDTSLEGLGALRAAFGIPGKIGLHTAGNSSQTSDGAAALVLMHAKAVKAAGAQPLGRFRAFNVYADRPDRLGPAQLVAIPRACELAGIKVEDVGLFEINEAFASVALLVMKGLKLDPEKVNVNGGAIALGHPLGCTGAKLSVQVLYEMKRRGAKYGVVTMCIGGGQGAAGVFELC